MYLKRLAFDGGTWSWGTRWEQKKLISWSCKRRRSKQRAGIRDAETGAVNGRRKVVIAPRLKEKGVGGSRKAVIARIREIKYWIKKAVERNWIINRIKTKAPTRIRRKT